MHANRGPRYCLSVSAAHSSTLALTTCRAWWLQSEARAGHGQGQWADSGELVIEPAAATTTTAAAAADRRGDDQGQGQAAEAGSGGEVPTEDVLDLDALIRLATGELGTNDNAVTALHELREESRAKSAMAAGGATAAQGQRARQQQQRQQQQQQQQRPSSR
eukprot:COSAG06_NODE_9896_length_1794_cov_1.781121_2_plen_162_part_00